MVSREFSDLTAQDQMKWNVIEPVRGGRDFGPGDAIAGYAAAQGMRLKGHTLLWHRSLPGWVGGLSADPICVPPSQPHIRDVAGHFRGRVHAWDVVNEAVSDDGSACATPCSGRSSATATSPRRSGSRARPIPARCSSTTTTAAKGRRKGEPHLRPREDSRQGVPIDGVGLQMHISANNRPRDGNIAANMRRLAEPRLVVHISEMDVKVNSVPGTTAQKLEAQKRPTNRSFRVAWPSRGARR